MNMLKIVWAKRGFSADLPTFGFACPPAMKFSTICLLGITLLAGQCQGQVIENFILYGPEVEVDIPDISAGQKLFNSLREHQPDSVIIIDGSTGKKATASEVLQASVDVASGLAKLGVTKNDTVTIIGENTFEVYIASLATLYLGAATAPVDPTLKSLEFQHILNILKPKVIFCSWNILPEVKDAWAKLEFDAKFVVVDGEGQKLDDSDLMKFEEIKVATDVEDFLPNENVDMEKDTAAIICSSGTSGMPKGVALSHKALIFQVEIFKSNFPKVPFLHCSYVYWVSGVIIMMGTTVRGVPRLLVRTTEALLVMEAIDKYQPYLGMMPPGLVSAILNHPRFDEFDYSSFMGVIVGGSPITKTLVDTFNELMPHCYMKGGYGLSEMAGLVSQSTPPTDILSLGTVTPNTQIKIVDLDTGEALGPGMEGEIVCKSPSIMIGYVGNEKATAKAIDEDGWYHTGDLGKYTDEGIIYMTGRAKELMKVYGHQISPEEIESVIAEMDGVLDVAVAGITDEQNNLPMALVVKKLSSQLTEEDIMNEVNTELSESKRLRAGVHFVKNIPRTSTGKIKRREVQPIAEGFFHTPAANHLGMAVEVGSMSCTKIVSHNGSCL